MTNEITFGKHDMTTLSPTGFLTIGASDLEYRMIGPSPENAPTIVMLHEGLGSAGLWGDFPEKLQAATGAGVFVYSRAGYGASTPVKLPRPLDYMHVEALDVLPKLLDARSAFAAGCCSGIPTAPRSRRSMPAPIRITASQGVALIAPHFIVEDISVASIAEIKTAYETTNLKEKLSRWHKDVDNAFYGWNGAWLDPEIPQLGYFRIPRLYPRAGRDPAGCGRPVWDHAPGRDRAGRVLLSGRCDGHPGGGTSAAS
jgi:hypothetical protein